MKAAVLLPLALVATGCKEKDRSLAGVDRWNVNTARLADATRCVPEKLADGRDGAYCFGQKPMGIRGMAVEIDLYFASMKPDARLVEIQMKAGGCKPEELESWMRQKFGQAEGQGTVLTWKNTHLFAIGYLPLRDEPGRCLIRIVPAFEKAWFDAIVAAPATAPAP